MHSYKHGESIPYYLLYFGPKDYINNAYKFYSIIKKKTTFFHRRLGFNQNFVFLDYFLAAAKWNVQWTMRWMHFTRCQRTGKICTANEQWLSAAGVAAVNGIWWDITMAWWHPFHMAMTQYFIVVCSDFLSTVGDISDLLARQHLCGQKVTFMESPSNIDLRTVCIVSGVDGTFWQGIVRRALFPRA